MNALHRTFAVASLFWLSIAPSACAQVTYDAASGLYTVMVYNDAGTLVPMTIQSPGRVQALPSATVATLADGRYRYTWIVRVAGTSPDPLGTVWVPCPADADVDSLRFIGPASHGRVVNGTRHRDAGVEYCEFFTRVPPGDSLKIELVTNYLPGFGSLRSQGFVRGASWPTSDPSVANDKFVRTVDSLSGLDASGVHVVVPSVVPIRPPTALSQSDVAVNVLLSDLAQACAKGWISPRGVCQSLEVKLTSLRRSLASGNLGSARAQLQAFQREVSNQEPAHISPEAASVLLALAGKLGTLF